MPVRHRPSGSSAGGQFAPDLSGRDQVPTGADPAVRLARASGLIPEPAPASEYSTAYDAYREQTGAAPARTRCPRCGQYDSTGHACPSGRGGNTALKVAVAVAVAVDVALTAGALAIGPWAAVPIIAIGIGWVLMKDALARNRVRALIDTASMPGRAPAPDFAAAEASTRDLAGKLGVTGSVAVSESIQVKGGSPLAAGAIRIGPDESLVMVGPSVLDLPPAQQRAVLAHEVAHLQKGSTARARRITRLAYPAALAAGTAVTVGAGMAVLPAVAVAAAAYVSMVLAGKALERREERRADRVAYQESGEHLAEALRTLHTLYPARKDRFGRTEDLLQNHGSLENRLADMRKH
jgi:Zn-dependent protease with chaperone function